LKPEKGMIRTIIIIHDFSPFHLENGFFYTCTFFGANKNPFVKFAGVWNAE
jgi:hypothetical protein